MPRQQAFDFPQWGGRRAGAGRKPLHPRPGLIRPGVPHLRRPALKARHPAHVTLRLLAGLPSLRRHAPAAALKAAFAAAQRPGFRLVHYSIQGNHLHLIVEASDGAALSRGMQGLAIRCARALNRAARRSGKVFADRYHAHHLATRREVANALRYVLENARHHGDHTPRDPYTSQRWLWRAPGEDAPVRAPRTWLLRLGWRPDGRYLRNSVKNGTSIS